MAPAGTTDNEGSDAFQQTQTVRRKWIFRAIACGVPILLGLVTVVWILIAQGRLFFDSQTGAPKLRERPIYLEEPGHEVTGHRYVYDERLGWRNIPNWNATSLGRKLTINSRGLRDKEYSQIPAQGARRILVLGDSYTWGYGVEDAEIFTEVLETQLADEGSWEVINAGVSGWGTDQEYLFLQDEGFDYEPDIVVLAFFLMNDPVNNIHSNQYGLHKPVFLGLDLKLGNVPVPRPTSDTRPFLVDVDAVELTCAIIGAMADACRQKGCQFVVMKFGPFLHPGHAGVEELDSRFQAVLQKHDVPFFFDLDKAFEERSVTTDGLTKGNDDGHWNAAGHQHTASLLLEFLQHSRLIENLENAPAFPN